MLALRFRRIVQDPTVRFNLPTCGDADEHPGRYNVGVLRHTATYPQDKEGCGEKAKESLRSLQASDLESFRPHGAVDGIRTRSPHHGKVVRYQLRHNRIPRIIVT